MLESRCLELANSNVGGGCDGAGRRRGRWSQPKSVQRYTKTHLLTQHLAKVPKQVTARGREIMKDPIKSLLPFLCQKDPKVQAVAAAWRRT